MTTVEEMNLNKPTEALLYTDTIGGKQVCRDDMWAVSTEQIRIYVDTLRAIRSHWREFGPDHGFDELLERSCLGVLGEEPPLQDAEPHKPAGYCHSIACACVGLADQTECSNWSPL